MYIRICIYIYVYVCIYIYMYVCVCVCVYVNVHGTVQRTFENSCKLALGSSRKSKTKKKKVLLFKKK